MSNDHDLIRLANEMASRVDAGLASGKLESAIQDAQALAANHSTVATIAQEQKEPEPAVVLATFVARIVEQIGNVQKKKPEIADLLPIAVISGIIDEYVKAGVPKDRVYQMIDKFYE